MRANHTKEPLWLQLLLAQPTLTFFEGEGDGDSGDAGDSGDSGDDAGDSGDSSGDDSGDSGDDGKGDEGDDKGRDTAGLKSALEKERRDRKRLEKEAKQLRREKEERENAEKSEVDKATGEAEKRTKQVTALATKLKTNALNTAILKAAQASKFRDSDDALALVNRSDIGVEQDEDDPAEIEIDEKSVEAAVKALAKKKPHLLIAEGDTDPSGSSFGRRKSKDDLDDEALKAKYAALR